MGLPVKPARIQCAARHNSQVQVADGTEDAHTELKDAIRQQLDLTLEDRLAF
jgi:hypothetical protein